MTHSLTFEGHLASCWLVYNLPYLPFFTMFRTASNLKNQFVRSFATSYIMPRVFFITGTSTGFGYHLVEEVLAKGDIAIATARKPEALSFKNTSDKV